ncbi:MAG: transcription elongation factor GreA [Bacteroidia bacterium]|nr:transcription elongation factor GreA [Bacteroidia bacterium]
MATNYMTKEGFEALIKEIEQLEKVERPRISAQIAEAREKGDLSENAEYDAAKEAQGLLEMKIVKLKAILSESRIIDETKIDLSKVGILTKVTVLNLKTNTKVSYIIVSEKEANIKTGKISSKSPIGLGLLGKKVGDKVEIKIPAGTINFEILEIAIA